MHANWEQLVSEATRWVIVLSCVFHFLFVLLLFFLQIGCRFWDLALQEHAQYNKVVGHSLQCPSLLSPRPPSPPPPPPPSSPLPATSWYFPPPQAGIYDEPISSFFRNVDMRFTICHATMYVTYQCCNISCCLCVPGLPTLQTYLWERVKTR